MIHITVPFYDGMAEILFGEKTSARYIKTDPKPTETAKPDDL
jgi:hypothetical protein